MQSQYNCMLSWSKKSALWCSILATTFCQIFCTTVITTSGGDVVAAYFMFHPLTRFQNIILFSWTTSGNWSVVMPSFSNMFSSSFLKTSGLRYGTVIISLSSGALDTKNTGIKRRCWVYHHVPDSKCGLRSRRKTVKRGSESEDIRWWRFYPPYPSPVYVAIQAIVNAVPLYSLLQGFKKLSCIIIKTCSTHHTNYSRSCRKCCCYYARVESTSQALDCRVDSPKDCQ